MDNSEPDVEAGTDGFTVEQWLSFEGAGDLRVELIDGKLVVNPAPSGLHQLVTNNLVLLFADVLRSLDLTVKATGMGVVAAGMRPAQGPIPDVLVARSPSAVADAGVLAASDVALAVEVLSPSSRPWDRARKLELYAQMGIPHYWIVDPRPPVTVTTLGLVESTFQETASVSGDDELRVDLPFAVIVCPSKLAEG